MYAAIWGRFGKNVVLPRAIYYFNNQLRVPKSLFWIGALNLSHTLGRAAGYALAQRVNVRDLIICVPL